jgi:hypothetical protein
MTINAALYAGLARYRPPGAEHRKAALDVPVGATVRGVWRVLGMRDHLACLPVVNGVLVTTERVLRDGEALCLFPPRAGGADSRDSSAYLSSSF